MPDIETAIKNDLTWLQKHERIIIVALVLLFGAWLGGKFLDGRILDAQNKVAIATQKLTDQEAANKQSADQVAQAVQQYQTLINTLSTQNAALASAVATRNAALAKQQSVDTNLTLPDLAVRWKNLSSLSDSEVAVTAGGIAVTDSGARKTVAILETVPVLQANLKDETVTATNLQTELTQANTVIGKDTEQIVGLQATVDDQKTKYEAQISVLKKQSFKSKIKWFLSGVVVGFLGRGQI